MTKEELEDQLIDLCDQYRMLNGLDECHFDFGLSIYPNSINTCLCIDDGTEED